LVVIFSHRIFYGTLSAFDWAFMKKYILVLSDQQQ